MVPEIFVINHPCDIWNLKLLLFHSGIFKIFKDELGQFGFPNMWLLMPIQLAVKRINVRTNRCEGLTIMARLSLINIILSKNLTPAHRNGNKPHI